MSKFRPIYWLHLSDLHIGARGKEIFYQVTQDLLQAIEKHARINQNPPDFILLSGDVAFSGKPEEYETADAFLGSLRQGINTIYGTNNPMIVPVPGNHDLCRPRGKEALAYDVFNRYAESPEDDPSVWCVNKLIWEDKDPDFLGSLFVGYKDWLNRQMSVLSATPGITVYPGIIPGDLCIQLALKDTFPLCIMGMNSAWLQYSDADFDRKLAIPTSQFHQLLPQVGRSNPLDLFHPDQRALLMMHHPPSWFSSRAQNMFYSEIFLPDRFDLCLFGHMHSGRSQQTATSGGAPRYEFQAPSLCGLENFGKSNEQREFGFTFGSLTQEGEIRVWPYKRVPLAGKEQAFLPDQSFGGDFTNRTEGVLIRPKDSPRNRPKVKPAQPQPPVSRQSTSEGVVIRMVLVNSDSPLQYSLIEFFNEQIAKVSDSLALGESIEIIDCSWEGEFTLFLPRIEKRSWSEMSVLALQVIFQVLTALKDQTSKYSSSGMTPQVGIAMHMEHEGHRLALHSNIPSGMRLFGEAIDYVRSMLPTPHKPFVLLSDDAYRYLHRFLDSPGNFEKLMQDTGFISAEVGPVRADIRTLTIAPQQYWDGGGNANHPFETHDIYNICIWSGQGKLLLGDTHVPPNRLRIDYGRQSDERVFIERLVNAERVCIIGVTNQYLVGSLHAALLERQRLNRGFWEEIRVVFLARELLNTVLDHRCKYMDIPKATEDRSLGWGQGVREVREFFLSCGTDDSQKWECLQFNFMLPFESKRFDDADGNYIIQMVPILPNGDVRESYCIEATNGSLLHTQLSNALDAIMRTATPIVEFNVYGHAEADIFNLAGVVSQREWRRFNPPEGGVPCFPVSFILLHTNVGGIQRVLLQNRTIFNTGGDFDLYSLISGKVNDEDFFFPKLPSNDYRYLAYQVSTSSDNNLRGTLSKKFAEELSLTLGKPILSEIMEDVWKKTAIRELAAELGVRINGDRLEPYPEPFVLDRKEGFTLYIKLYTLELQPEELAQIQRVRPNANLKTFTLRSIQEYKDKEKLSVFLCTHFEQYILPLLRNQIGVQ